MKRIVLGLLFTLAIAAGGLFIFLNRAEEKAEILPAGEKKVLVLVIASDNHPAFGELQEVWKSYMNLDPKHVKTYFLKGDPTLAKASEIKGDTLYTKIQDSYKPGILTKTLLSLEALSDKLDGYDYIVRTNLSSVYNFPKLLSYVSTLPKEKAYAATPLVPVPSDVPREFVNVPFGWGAGFIMSPDLAKMLVANKDLLIAQAKEVPDDVAIGAFFFQNKINLIPTTTYTFNSAKTWDNVKNSLPDTAFHFRAKSNYTTRTIEEPYDEELKIASSMVKKFYPNAKVKEQYSSVYPLDITLPVIAEFYTTYPSDINEHLPVLRELAKECCSVTEIGVRSMVASWSILKGLSENPAKTRTYVGIDLDNPPLHNMLLAKKLATENQIGYQFVKGNDMTLDIEPTDLLFIDSMHTYAHLTYELEKFSPKAKKYIALHDTSQPWEDKDDYEYHGDYSEYPKEIDKTKRGLWPAVVDFLQRHPEWSLKERRLNNHGFTVLERKKA